MQSNIEPYSLAYYAAQAKGKPIAQLQYALRDIAATLQIYKEHSPSHPYAAKLWAEFDAITSEITRRARPRKVCR